MRWWLGWGPGAGRGEELTYSLVPGACSLADVLLRPGRCRQKRRFTHLLTNPVCPPHPLSAPLITASVQFPPPLAGFLDRIKQAYQRDPDLTNLLVDPEFAQDLADKQAAWRRVVQLAVGAGIAAPGITSSLSYFDTYRRGRLPANLVQVRVGQSGVCVRPRAGWLHQVPSCCLCVIGCAALCGWLSPACWLTLSCCCAAPLLAFVSSGTARLLRLTHLRAHRRQGGLVPHRWAAAGGGGAWPLPVVCTAVLECMLVSLCLRPRLCLFSPRTPAGADLVPWPPCGLLCAAAVWDKSFGSADSITTTGYNS